VKIFYFPRRQILLSRTFDFGFNSKSHSGHHPLMTTSDWLFNLGVHYNFYSVCQRVGLPAIGYKAN